MGKLILHTGPSGPYYFFKEKIRGHLEAGESNFLYLLPVNRAVRYLKKIMAAEMAPRALADPNVFTFDGLFRYLYTRLPDRKIVAGRLVRLTFLNHLFRSANSDFEYFGSGRGRLIIKIDRMLSELLEFGIYGNSDRRPPASCLIKYRDFQRIIKALFEQYGDQLVDEYAIPGVVLDNLTENRIGRWLGKDLKVYVNGYGIFTPPMIDLLSRLKNWCDIEVKLDYLEYNRNLFGHTRDALEMLKRLADDEQEYDPADNLGAALFNPGINQAQEEKQDKKFALITGRDRQDEIVRIAARIKAWQREGTPLHQIGITFPDLEAYAPLVRRIFSRHGIPFNLSTGFPMAESPLILAFLQILEVLLSGFETGTLFKLLISPFCFAARNIDIHLFMRLTADLRIRHLSGSWQKRFLTLAGEGPDLYHISRNDFEHQVAKISEIVNIIRRLEIRATTTDLFDGYLGILKDLGMLDWQNTEEKFLKRDQREKEFRAFNRFMKIVDQVKWILAEIHKKEDVQPDTIYRYLKPVIQETTYSLREWSGYGVQIMPRLEILSVQSKKLCIGGLLEGEFPRRFTHDIFFSDGERRELGLNAAEDLVEQDRFLFYQLINSPADEIILSYPLYEGEAALLPSTFIDNLSTACRIAPPVKQDDRTWLIDAGNFLEDLSGRLTTGLTGNELSDLRNWAALYGNEHVAYWLNGVEQHLGKQRRDIVGDCEGNLKENGVILSMLRDKYHNYAFSVSALESYAFCPMQFFLQRVIGLEEEEPAEEYISPREKGALIHQILFRFYTSLRENKALHVPRQHRQELMRIAQEEIDRLPYEGLLWTVEKEVLFGKGSQKGLLDQILDSDQAFITETGYAPRFFELAFGRAGRSQTCDPDSLKEPFVLRMEHNTLLLTGKIDRIDADDKGNAIIVDYKLSASMKGKRLPDMMEGSSLQLPVYALAATEILKHIRPVAAAYFQVKDSRNCGRRYVFADGSADLRISLSKNIVLGTEDLAAAGMPSFENLLEIVKGHIFRYISTLTAGDFTHTRLPDDERCSRNCTFSRICRKDVGKLRYLAGEGGHE